MTMLLRGDRQRLLPTKLAMADESFDVLLETGVCIQPFPIREDEWQTRTSTQIQGTVRNVAETGGGHYAQVRAIK
jgi:hypothetical protein